jgi:glycosyltransferase involved in cell wall biosynthesis
MVISILILGVFFMFGLIELVKRKRRGRGTSIIIPFRSPKTTDVRTRNLAWLVRYWKHHLPGAEVIIGDDPDTDLPFSKAVAINRAVAKSKGDVLVLVDADGFLTADRVMHCVDEIRDARRRGNKLWFMPYRKFYRLSNEATLRMLNSDVRNPYAFPDTVDQADIMNVDSDPTTAHRYGALIQILPREAFEIVGGWDERMRGWGAEDHAAMRATDTLYGPHKTLPTSVLHLWHPMIGSNGSADIVHWKDRRWEGQDDPAVNNNLSYRYYHAYLKPVLMRKLVDEWKKIERRREREDHCPAPPVRRCSF